MPNAVLSYKFLQIITSRRSRCDCFKKTTYRRIITILGDRVTLSRNWVNFEPHTRMGSRRKWESDVSDNIQQKMASRWKTVWYIGLYVLTTRGVSSSELQLQCTREAIFPSIIRILFTQTLYLGHLQIWSFICSTDTIFVVRPSFNPVKIWPKAIIYIYIFINSFFR